MRKTMVTLPEELIQAVDIAAGELGETRSKFTRQSLIARLERIKREKFETLMAEGYREMENVDLHDAEAYLGALADVGEEESGDHE